MPGSYGSQGTAVAVAAFGRPSCDLTPSAVAPTLHGIVMVPPCEPMLVTYAPATG